MRYLPLLDTQKQLWSSSSHNLSKILEQAMQFNNWAPSRNIYIFLFQVNGNYIIKSHNKPISEILLTKFFRRIKYRNLT